MVIMVYDEMHPGMDDPLFDKCADPTDSPVK